MIKMKHMWTGLPRRLSVAKRRVAILISASNAWCSKIIILDITSIFTLSLNATQIMSSSIKWSRLRFSMSEMAKKSELMHLLVNSCMHSISQGVTIVQWRWKYKTSEEMALMMSLLYFRRSTRFSNSLPFSASLTIVWVLSPRPTGP